MGREANPGKITEKYAREAGFVNIQEKMIKIPLGPWPKEKRLVSPPCVSGTGQLQQAKAKGCY